MQKSWNRFIKETKLQLLNLEKVQAPQCPSHLWELTTKSMKKALAGCVDEEARFNG